MCLYLFSLLESLVKGFCLSHWRTILHHVMCDPIHQWYGPLHWSDIVLHHLWRRFRHILHHAQCWLCCIFCFMKLSYIISMLCDMLIMYVTSMLRMYIEFCKTFMCWHISVCFVFSSLTLICLHEYVVVILHCICCCSNWRCCLMIDAMSCRTVRALYVTTDVMIGYCYVSHL